MDTLPVKVPPMGVEEREVDTLPLTEVVELGEGGGLS
jgi:hypothetical protein